MNIWQELNPHFLALAPMEGVTDLVFRQVIQQAAPPDLFFTEFTNVSSFASEKGRHNALERLEIAPTEGRAPDQTPIIAQIWGKNPAHFSELSSALASLGFQGLDINMGCPDRHVNKAGGGAAMILNPELALDCIKQAQAATSLPVSVKTRLGFSSVEEYATWLPLLLRQNLPALTVHLRTRKEMSKVPAHFELIPNLLELRDAIAPHTKLIINGDITDRAQAETLWRQHPAVDGFMIGRGIFADPFCFRNFHSRPRIKQSELVELFLFHLKLHDQRTAELAGRGSRYPFEPLKHFFKVYLNNFDGAADLRAQLMPCTTTDQLRQILSTQSFD